MEGWGSIHKICNQQLGEEVGRKETYLFIWEVFSIFGEKKILGRSILFDIGKFFFSFIFFHALVCEWPPWNLPF